MPLDPANNLAETELTASVSDTATTLPVADASVFPDADTEGAFNVLVWDANANINPSDAPDAEFVRVTATDTTADELTVQRGQEDTPASAKASGSTVTDTWSVKDRDDIDAGIAGKADDPHGSESHSSEVVHEGEDAAFGETTHDSVSTEKASIGSITSNLGEIERDTVAQWSGAVGPDGVVRDENGTLNGQAGRFAKWIWFVKPRAIQKNGVTYIGYNGGVTGRQNVVMSYDHNTGSVETTVLHDSFSSDDHVNPSLLFRDDGRLVCFWTRHNGDTIYYRISDNEEDVSSFGPRQEISQTDVTYTQPFQLTDATDNPIRLHFRERDTIGGDGHLHYRESIDGGDSWSDDQRLVETSSGHYGIYFVICRNDAEGLLHYFCTDAHGAQGGKKQDVRHMQYDESLDEYQRADGTTIGASADAPFSFDELEIVYETDASGNHSAWVWDCGLDAVDNNGEPAVVFSTFPTSEDHKYHISLWSSTHDEWFQTKIADAGGSIEEKNQEPYYSAGISMARDNARLVYTATQKNGVSQLSEHRVDSLANDRLSKTIVSQSTDHKITNTRPVNPIGGLESDVPVLWMSGGYPDAQTPSTALRGVPGLVPGSLSDLNEDDVVTLGTDPLQQRQFSEGLSISAGFKTGSSIGATQDIFNALNFITLQISRTGTGTIDFGLYDGSSNPVVTWGDVESHTEYFVEGKWDGTVMELWVDGELKDSTSFDGPIALDERTSNWSLNRNHEMGASSSNHWRGEELGHYRLLRRATTDDESRLLADLFGTY